ncbi:uncharacterized protein LAESUDRAFT_728021 [Laetiporus sulphureus 93-53]|uniref:SPX domain-containing protein n=1 Tax=Laetiporus sulphureus 93-53 TaxID=1314785 RepID=A0A165DC69_9APHY|nr:uncharacterized protein LAESUDRAFT_728021 [Laetiporus sulphureus 93-53]KZT04537.1 hypothetical protein LAESUDRAFT_728021 [Laetiporus sulphureus 93-53]
MYRDYRGLKKRITAVRRAQDESLIEPGDAMPLARSPYSSAGSGPRSVHSEAYGESTSHVIIRDATQQSTVGGSGTLEDQPASPTSLKTINIVSTSTSVLPRLRRRSTALSTMRTQVSPSPQELPLKLSEDEFVRASLDYTQASSIHVDEVGTAKAMTTPPWAPGSHPPLHELLPLLTPVQRAFFDMLDGELDKVESFFCAKERELSARYQAVEKQLEELKGHRRAFHVCALMWSLFRSAIPPCGKSYFCHNITFKCICRKPIPLQPPNIPGYRSILL